MRIVVLIIGLLALAMGLLWVGQGTGYVMWPKSSFMLTDMKWAYIGGATALAGLIAIVWSRR
ncbi:MAG: hypothetical protein GC166_06895 [Alphaproteobacteria bacterium]|nr:hypothetical protein [Alphaproteobacteria bacterium]